MKEVVARTLFGVPIHAVTMDQSVDRCAVAIERREPLLVGVVNAAKIVKMQQDALLRESVLSAGLVIADGAAVVWASRLLRRPLPERVTGIDLFLQLLALADRMGASVFFLGARPDVLATMIERVKGEYPALRIAGARDGYYDEREREAVAEEIRAARPDILFVGMTSPKKERFLADFHARLAVPVCHGVGGSFDILAGVTKRAPRLWQRAGCEWLYRTFQEPRRLWKRYLVTNTLFVWMVLCEIARRRPAPAGASARASG